MSTGHKQQAGKRNSPTVYNAAGHFVQFWDGREPTIEELADKVAELNGSWAFIIGLGVVTVIWFLINKPGLIGNGPFDAYPYTFFNLLLAILVSLQGPLIVMSQNRQTIKDRATAATDFKVNLKNEVNIETILRELGEFRAGTSAAWLGVVPAAIVGGLCTLGVVGGWMLAFQTLRQVDRFEEAAQATGAAPLP